MDKINIALADDELLFLQGLKAILGNEENINILFTAQDGEDLVQQLREAKILPEIVI